MPTKPCGHFSAEVELIVIPNVSVVLRVPVRRCALAEQMIAMLYRTDDGREVGAKIQILESISTAHTSPQSRFRAAFGPDLEAINRAECTAERCRESCTVGYRQVLRHFGYFKEADEETGGGCLELPEGLVDTVT